MKRLLQQRPSVQAQKRHEAVAVVFQGQRVSYGELENESNQLAKMLVEAGCKRGDRIALMVPKSPAAIIGMLGTLKADCMYVPVDTSMPAARVGKILSRSSPQIILATGEVAHLLEELVAEGLFDKRLRIGWLDERSPQQTNFKPVFNLDDIAAQSTEPRSYANSSQDGAHLLFTSGSTGEPKGVMITHENVLHFIEWGIDYFGINPSDRNSGHPAFHFDLSTFDIYGSLAAGAELHLVGPEVSLLPHKLAAFIRESELTQWFSVPSILNYMAKFDVVRNNDFPPLKRLLWCGEVFPTPPLIYWMNKLPHVTFTNLYGPTEATIASSYYTLSKCPENEEEVVPIGKACRGEDLFVLDENLKPAPQGETGELYIGGVGLSPGYWEDPEKTAAAFVLYRNGSSPTHRIYKTGDLARVGEDGLVYYLGRADSQIKSRGYRIELGEIEVALNAILSLLESAVVGVKTDGFEGTTICCAYVAEQKSGVTPAIIRKQLSHSLPSYMLPARWMAMDKLPKNANGKIDRRKLREFFERGEDQRGREG